MRIYADANVDAEVAATVDDGDIWRYLAVFGVFGQFGDFGGGGGGVTAHMEA